MKEWTLMQTSNRLFDDLAKVASGAASAVVGLRQEFESLVRQRIERLIDDFDLITRDEFEAVKAMAAHARAEQEKLEARVAELEAKLAAAGQAPGSREESTKPETESDGPGSGEAQG
jgi:BMFP domain-containing protein YqiC